MNATKAKISKIYKQSKVGFLILFFGGILITSCTLDDDHIVIEQPTVVKPEVNSTGDILDDKVEPDDED